MNISIFGQKSIQFKTLFYLRFINTKHNYRTLSYNSFSQRKYNKNGTIAKQFVTLLVSNKAQTLYNSINNCVTN